MKSRKNHLPFFFPFLAMVCCSLWSPMPCGAATGAVAVLPFADLSAGDLNAMDLEATIQVEERLREMAFDVAPSEKVHEFMAQNRMRWVGYLDRFFATNIGDALGVDWILLGTITDRREKPRPAMSLTLLLVDARKARPVWGRSFFMAAGEMVKPLEIGAITTLSELSARLYASLVIDIPDLDVKVSNEIPVYTLDSYELSGRYVEGGGRMECRVGFRFFDERPEDVFLKLGGKRISQVSMERDGNFYRGTWTAPKEEGRYPISTVVRWKDRREDSKFLATYRVVNELPAMTLAFGNGIPVGPEGIVAFRDYLHLAPKLTKAAPIKSYRFLVTTVSGSPVLDYRNNEPLPEGLLWRGTGDQGALGSGRYVVTLSITDDVGHTVSDTAQVYVRRSPPLAKAAIGYDAEKERAQLLFEREPDKGGTGELDPVPVKYWSLRMVDTEQNTVIEQEGDNLPVTIPFDPGQQTNFFCSYEVRDMLGNSFKQKAVPLRLLAAGEEEEEKKDVGEWTDGF